MSDKQTIFDALDLKEHSIEEQEEILNDMSEFIFQGTLTRLIDQMDDATQAEFEALMDQDAPAEEIEAFLEKRVPGAQKAVEDTIREITDDILAVTKNNDNQ